MAIEFHSEQIDFQLSKPNKHRNWLMALAASENGVIEKLSYIFSSDAALLKLNQEYLNHNTYTDIITFPYHEGGQPIVGEIYISIDRVRDNAETYQVPFEDELRRVMAHGLLHLLGYEDDTEDATKLMRQHEDKALKLFHQSFT